METDITTWLNKEFEGVSFDKEDGRTFADKSYAFDTMFFMARFIEHFRFGDMFQKAKYRGYANDYTRFIFMLRDGAAQIGNYLTEAISLLRFAGVMEEVRRGVEYRILDLERLLFVSSSFENAYIFNYMLAYNLMRHYGWWDLYRKFCHEPSIDGKERIVWEIRNRLVAVNPHVSEDTDSNWGMFTTKYILEILNYANAQNHVTRKGRVTRIITSIEDVSLNVQGTRVSYGIKKRNAYLKDFSRAYVLSVIKDYLAVDIDNLGADEYSPSLAEDIADTRLHLYDRIDKQDRPRALPTTKYKVTATGKTRTVHGEFRGGLWKSTPHVCPVCGFQFEDFLIASHIVPYAKCEDIYDAMNSYNGLLMCPVCDKLFESANYITIDAKTGQLRYAPEIEHEPDFQYLRNASVRDEYINCERRHYLKWHNDEFDRKHKKDPDK